MSKDTRRTFLKTVGLTVGAASVAGAVGLADASTRMPVETNALAPSWLSPTDDPTTSPATTLSRPKIAAIASRKSGGTTTEAPFSSISTDGTLASVSDAIRIRYSTCYVKTIPRLPARCHSRASKRPLEIIDSMAEFSRKTTVNIHPDVSR